MNDLSGPVDGDRPQALYRLCDAKDRPLYIGVSDSWPRRMGQHRATKSWFPEVRTVRLEYFPDRESVLVAERQAIEREEPRYNIQHNTGCAITLSAWVTVRVSPEDFARNMAGLGMLACAAILALRWLADVGSAWWMQRRLAAAEQVGEDRVVVMPRPRNPFTEVPQPAAVRLFEIFAAVACNPSLASGPFATGAGRFLDKKANPQPFKVPAARSNPARIPIRGREH
jgi:predicted GIY-YIG superfamily endonuclease